METGSRDTPCAPLPDASAEREDFSSYIDSIGIQFSQFPDPVLVTDSRRNIVHLNDAARALLGLTRSENGRPSSEMVLESEIPGEQQDFVEKCLRGETLRDSPVRIRDIFGQWRMTSVTASPAKDCTGRIVGCLAIARRIDAAHPSISEMQEAILKNESILTNFPTPFFTVDNQLVITSMNSPMEALTGFGKEEAVGKLACYQIFNTDHCRTEECLLKQAMETGRAVSGVRRTITDWKGRRVPMVISASIITDSKNRVVGGFESLRDITSELENEHKIELLTELSQEGILMADESGRIIFANSKMAEISGFSTEQLLQMNIDQILSHDQHQVVAELIEETDPEKRLRFCSMLQLFGKSSGGLQAFETCVGISRLGNKVLACLYFRDITERIEVEKELRKSNNFLHNIIQESVNGIVVLDSTGDVVIFNEGAERILGYRAEEVIHHPEVFRESYKVEVAKENMRKMRSDSYGPPGKLTATRISMRAKNGEMIPVDFSASIITDGDREIGSVGIFSDRREGLKLRKQLEDARMQLLQSEKIASLGRLAAGVAHEINNPLAGILVYAEILSGELNHSSQCKEDIQQIIDQTMRCRQIVMRLLEFSRQPLGHKLSFEIHEVVDRTVALLGNLFKEIKFELREGPDLPPVVGDSGQIQQVFMNIITNAAYAMNGKGRLVISSSFDRDARMVELAFTDSGPGIPPEIEDKIFDPFFTTKQPGQGTGLGLSVAYGIVHQHGGEIRAGNAPGGGAVFTIRLPLESPESMVEMFEEDNEWIN